MPPPPSAALPVPRLFGLKEDSRYIEEEEELVFDDEKRSFS